MVEQDSRLHALEMDVFTVRCSRLDRCLLRLGLGLQRVLGILKSRCHASMEKKLEDHTIKKSDGRNDSIRVGSMPKFLVIHRIFHALDPIITIIHSGR